MTYNKPTIDVVGDVSRVVQGVKGGPISESSPPFLEPNTPVPAYELDE